LCKKLLAERLGCTVPELPQRGFVVLSAGVSAMMGTGATAEAIEIARRHDADLSTHVSQPLSGQLLAQADRIFTMTHSHLRAVVTRFPRIPARIEVLSPRGEDLDDPIGGDCDVYGECAQQILAWLRERLPEIHPSGTLNV
jgi:protein-tyrosine phosphatase